MKQNNKRKKLWTFSKKKKWFVLWVFMTCLFFMTFYWRHRFGIGKKKTLIALSLHQADSMWKVSWKIIKWFNWLGSMNSAAVFSIDRNVFWNPFYACQPITQLHASFQCDIILILCHSTYTLIHALDNDSSFIFLLLSINSRSVYRAFQCMSSYV